MRAKLSHANAVRVIDTQCRKSPMPDVCETAAKACVIDNGTAKAFDCTLFAHGFIDDLLDDGLLD